MLFAKRLIQIKTNVRHTHTCFSSVYDLISLLNNAFSFVLVSFVPSYNCLIRLLFSSTFILHPKLLVTLLLNILNIKQLMNKTLCTLIDSTKESKKGSTWINCRS